MINEDSFDIKFTSEDDKFVIKYHGEFPTKYKIRINDLDSNFPIYWYNAELNKEYDQFIHLYKYPHKKYENFNGFNVEFINVEKEEIRFNKKVILGNNPPVCKIDYTSDYFYMECDNYYHTFYESDFDKLNINEDTKWVVDLGSGTGTFIGWAYQNGAQNIIGIEANNTCYNISKKTFDNYSNITIYNKAIYKNSNTELSFYCRSEDEFIFNGSLIQTPELGREYSKIKTISLDEIFKIYKIDKLDILKCDIEGYEWELFYNLSDEFIKKIDKIHFEYHLNFNGEIKKLNERMDKIGYDIIYNGSLEDPMSTVIFIKRKEIANE